MAKTLSVSAIKDGTVIDHIPSGSAIAILELLKLLSSKHHISLGLNLSSPSLGHKDLIKIEDRFLTPKEAHDIAVFAPNATINIIKNYKVASKIRAQLPKMIKRILVCPNSRCITNSETVETHFLVEEHKQAVILRCHFCEKRFERSEIKEYRP